jgi:hypothetical protein
MSHIWLGTGDPNIISKNVIRYNGLSLFVFLQHEVFLEEGRHSVYFTVIEIPCYA